jgi:hypothetical protein
MTDTPLFFFNLWKPKDFLFLLNILKFHNDLLGYGLISLFHWVMGRFFHS